MTDEKQTDTMVYQILATKDIINLMETFMDEETVNQMCMKLLQSIQLSDKRKELNLQYAQENENGDSEIDKQNWQFMDEELKVEDEL